MSSDRRFVKDDENDALLFERWEAHVIEAHPNPQRIGCPSHETLSAFVEKPESVSLSDLNDTHITKCRECTLELKELRRLREERLSSSAALRHFKYWPGWRAAGAVAFCLALVAALVTWHYLPNTPQAVPTGNEVAALTVDLSGDGVSRSPAAESPVSLFALPRKVVDLDLVLPYFSPGGDYQITVVKDKNDRILAVARGGAVAQGAHTRAHVRVDLRQLAPGPYYLGTTRTGESTTYFYPFTLN